MQSRYLLLCRLWLKESKHTFLFIRWFSSLPSRGNITISGSFSTCIVGDPDCLLEL